MDWRKQRIIDNLYGPIGTILLHILVLVPLFTLVEFKRRSGQKEFETILQEIEEVEELDELEDELEELEDIPTVVEAVDPPTVSLDQEPPQVDTMRNPAEGADLDDFNVLESVSPLRFRGLYASRSAGGRGDALRAYGGGLGDRTEYAVMKALRWLNTHAYPDGSWGPHYRASMTSLALLAFFAHGETPASPEFGQAIRKGLQFLLSRQQDDGMFVYGGPVDYWGSPVKYADQLRVYEHAIATYAISEAYNLTKIPYLKQPMEAAVQAIINGQHDAGSWDYGYARGPDAHVDVSLAGWNIQALKAASAAGAANKGLKSAIEASIRGLKLRFRKTKKFQYSTRDEEHAEDNSMTAVAMLCMQLTGHALDDEARRAMTTIENCRFYWSPGGKSGGDRRQMGPWPLYAWYYLTQARFHEGKRGWPSWNRQFAPELCNKQNPDGSWCPPPRTSEGRFGPVYATTLAVLQLEVYYRFLPTYKPIDIDEGPSLEALDEDDEIVVTFG